MNYDENLGQHSPLFDEIGEDLTQRLSEVVSTKAMTMIRR